MSKSLDSQISRQMKKAGWVKVSSKKHEKWHCPCGQHRITKSTSMGRGRAAMNFRSYLKNCGPCSIDLKLG